MQIILPQQILVPKKVYIGDTAELRCTFNNPNTQLKQLVTNGTTELPLVSIADSHDDYEIHKITLSPAGVDFYQLTITFVPWKTGDLQFPPMEIEGTGIILEFQPVQIVSLISTDSANATTLHDSAAPLLLPGTAYKLYGTLTAFVIALIIIIRLIVKRKNLLFYINQKRLQKKYKKNKKKTIKLLKQTALATYEKDSLAAEKIQKILRNYLEVRFDFPFTRAVTSEIMKGFNSATGGLLSETKQEAFGDIAYSFIRTDFIRYSKNAAFEPGELKLLIEKLIDRIEILEATEKEEGEHHA